MQFPFVWRHKRQYTDKTLKWRKSMYMRASGASELRQFSHFYILKLLFLSIFCWYFRYFVGTKLMTCLSAYMYRQNSEKALWGGGGQLPPCHPLATLVTRRLACTSAKKYILQGRTLPKHLSYIIVSGFLNKLGILPLSAAKCHALRVEMMIDFY